MFLICKDGKKGLLAMNKLRSNLIQSVGCGPMVKEKIRDHYLFWFSCKPSDNLHAFSDGYLVGKISFEENNSDSIIEHIENMPFEIHPLLNCIKIKKLVSAITVESCNISNVYYSGDTVSDMQLLIADYKGLKPSLWGLSILGTVGYFPGNLTFFDQVKRIDFGCLYNVIKRQVQPITEFSLRYYEYGEKEIIQRLVGIVPLNVVTYLGLTSGFDSRFILGIMMKAGLTPTLIYMKGNEIEEQIVSEIANSTDLNLLVCTGPALPAATYSIMTDGQIYFRGGNFSRIRQHIASRSVFHTGLFADAIIKNAYPSRMLRPRIRDSLFEDLVDGILHRTTPTMITGLKRYNSKADIKVYLLDELAYQKDYINFKNNRDRANWFYYINRGVRWTPAVTADLSYFTYPVFVLSDLRAFQIGISSGTWDNINHDRTRRINQQLLPVVKSNYPNGSLYKKSAFMNTAQKIRQILISIFIVESIYKKFRKQKERKPNIGFEQIAERSKAELEEYLSVKPGNLLSGDQYSYRLKRAVITLMQVIDYLND